MKKHVCIHGHFYQPPRENPWIEKVEQQDSAYPFHDWNERISFECYEPNTASRLLSDSNEIIEIINNYAHMSFNFGPTLLSWLEANDPSTYQAILESDKQSIEKFSGHGAAMAQCYNHVIMPLANERDKETQVKWGIADFRHRFKREPEGMWLAETAVDVATLEALANNNILFTVLAPYQAARIRKTGDEAWQEIGPGHIDPKRPYLCKLPSGNKIVLFFYDGPLSNDVAFKGLLKNGKKYADRILEVFDYQSDKPQLVHLATDGESYGHHHRFGDMALAYCLHYIESHPDFAITVYGEYLEKFPPEYEVEILENTSWSCAHGIERWRSGCTCKISNDPKISTEWRQYLREAMDWLRDQLLDVYEKEAARYLKNPWKARNGYINVILNRSLKEREKFYKQFSLKELTLQERITANKLLEMQRNSMLMFTSCGWFFDDIARLEPIQIFRYASRAMQLANEISGISLEDEYLRILKKANCNDRKYKNGADVYVKEVNSVITNFERVGAHFAISSLFRDNPKQNLVNGFIVENKKNNKVEIGTKKLGIGLSDFQSVITEQKKEFYYAAIHLGDNNMLGGISENIDQETMENIEETLTESFYRNDVSKIMDILDEFFGSHSYSFWHLFRDEQIFIIDKILEQKKKDLKDNYRQLYNNNYPFMRLLVDRQIAMPRSLSIPGEFIVNQDLLETIQTKPLDIQKIHRLTEQAESFHFDLDKTTLDFVLSKEILDLLHQLKSDKREINHLINISFFLTLAGELEIELNLWKSQNVFYHILNNEKLHQAIINNAGRTEKENEAWLLHFNNVGKLLKIKV